jgi:hypothetical protein
VLQSGAMLRDAKLAYKSYGNLSSSKDNVIVYPTWYSGQHYDNEWLIGDGMALDPARYFIIIPNMLGNGLSSAPSNTPPPYDKARFPIPGCHGVVIAEPRIAANSGVVDEDRHVSVGVRHVLRKRVDLVTLDNVQRLSRNLIAFGPQRRCRLPRLILQQVGNDDG